MFNYVVLLCCTLLLNYLVKIVMLCLIYVVVVKFGLMTDFIISYVLNTF